MSSKHAIYGRLPGESANTALARAFGDCLALAPGDRLAVLSDGPATPSFSERLAERAAEVGAAALGPDGMHAALADTGEPVPWGLLTTFKPAEPALDFREPLAAERWVKAHGEPLMPDMDDIGFVAYALPRPSLDALAAAAARTLALMEEREGFHVPLPGTEEELLATWGRFSPHAPRPLDWDALRSSALEVRRAIGAAELRGDLDFNSFLWLAR